MERSSSNGSTSSNSTIPVFPVQAPTEQLVGALSLIKLNAAHNAKMDKLRNDLAYKDEQLISQRREMEKLKKLFMDEKLKLIQEIKDTKALLFDERHRNGQERRLRSPQKPQQPHSSHHYQQQRPQQIQNHQRLQQPQQPHHRGRAISDQIGVMRSQELKNEHMRASSSASPKATARVRKGAPLNVNFLAAQQAGPSSNLSPPKRSSTGELSEASLKRARLSASPASSTSSTARNRRVASMFNQNQSRSYPVPSNSAPPSAASSISGSSVSRSVAGSADDPLVISDDEDEAPGAPEPAQPNSSNENAVVDRRNGSMGMPNSRAPYSDFVVPFTFEEPGGGATSNMIRGKAPQNGNSGIRRHVAQNGITANHFLGDVAGTGSSEACESTGDCFLEDLVLVDEERDDDAPIEPMDVEGPAPTILSIPEEHELKAEKPEEPMDVETSPESFRMACGTPPEDIPAKMEEKDPESGAIEAALVIMKAEDVKEDVKPEMATFGAKKEKKKMENVSEDESLETSDVLMIDEGQEELQERRIQSEHVPCPEFADVNVWYDDEIEVVKERITRLDEDDKRRVPYVRPFGIFDWKNYTPKEFAKKLAENLPADFDGDREEFARLEEYYSTPENFEGGKHLKKPLSEEYLREQKRIHEARWDVKWQEPGKIVPDARIKVSPKYTAYDKRLAEKRGDLLALDHETRKYQKQEEDEVEDEDEDFNRPWERVRFHDILPDYLRRSPDGILESFVVAFQLKAHTSDFHKDYLYVLHTFYSDSEVRNGRPWIRSEPIHITKEFIYVKFEIGKDKQINHDDIICITTRIGDKDVDGSHPLSAASMHFEIPILDRDISPEPPFVGLRMGLHAVEN